MSMPGYIERRGELETYFDRTAVDAWSRLTSNGPLGRIRATVRAGRDEMRQTLLSWLPVDLRGARMLDAGCGTGSLAVEAARRGASVVAVDISPALIEIARKRLPPDVASRTINFVAGDMLDPRLGRFDYAVAMDSVIHYRAEDIVRIACNLASRTGDAVLMTFAPKTPALAAMHAVGRLFPRRNRAPAIEPIAEARLRRMLLESRKMSALRIGRTRRIDSGFYKSQALELLPI
jgi:magnesium-protoporphyrin O-methyltransferase